MKKSLIFIFLGIGMMGPLAVKAASLRLSVQKNIFDIGEPIYAMVLLDAQNEPANAIQMDVSFPASQFTVASVHNADSIVSLWITSPREVAPGHIALAGVIPGGFALNGGHIATFTLVPKAQGGATLAIASATVLLNDGNGTPARVALGKISFMVSSRIYAGSLDTLSVNSTTVPDPFTPVIAHDPNIFEGKYFLAFSTTDKGSGINHYEVQEAPLGAAVATSSWREAVSPYLLINQTLAEDVYVRAVANNGNVRVEKVFAPRAINWSNIMAVIVGLLLLGGLGYTLYLWRKKMR